MIAPTKLFQSPVLQWLLDDCWLGERFDGRSVNCYMTLIAILVTWNGILEHYAQMNYTIERTVAIQAKAFFTCLIVMDA